MPCAGPTEIQRGVQASFCRKNADIRSTATTITKITISSSETSRYWNRFIAVKSLEADAAGADEAEHQRRADVFVEPVKADAQQRRQHGRDDAVGEDLDAAGAGQRQRVDRRHIHVLDRFGKQPPEHADRMDGQRQTARKRTEPDGGDEKQRPDQIRHGAREADDAARDIIDVSATA